MVPNFIDTMQREYLRSTWKYEGDPIDISLAVNHINTSHTAKLLILLENENFVNITDVKTQPIKLKTNQLIRILNISDQIDQAIDANQADEEQKICTNEIAHEKIKERYKPLSYEAKVDIIERYSQKNQSRSKI